MKFLAVFLLLMTFATGWSNEVRIASYNVENLFDLKYDHREYVEYIPNTSWQWNQTNFNKKLKNLSKVIVDLDADIIALQEIESEVALKALQTQLKRDGVYYPHRTISKTKNTTIQVALLSRYPIQYSKEIWVTSSRKFRNILETKVNIDGNSIYLFVNHWKSKSGPESERIVSAKALKKRLYELGHAEPILLLGDFNSHYEENLLFIKKRKHNNTNGVTGINHILKTYHNTQPVSQKQLLTCKDCLYNLWYDIDSKERWSHVYRNSYEALDNLLISKGLLNGKIVYKPKSISHFKKDYMIKKNKPFRWQRSRGYPKFHTGKGYSDHLPVYADFIIK